MGRANAGELAILFLSANTARRLVGISVGIGSNRRPKLVQTQMVMALGGYRPGAPKALRWCFGGQDPDRSPLTTWQ